MHNIINTIETGFESVLGLAQETAGSRQSEIFRAVQALDYFVGGLPPVNEGALDFNAPVSEFGQTEVEAPSVDFNNSVSDFGNTDTVTAKIEAESFLTREDRIAQARATLKEAGVSNSSFSMGA